MYLARTFGALSESELGDMLRFWTMSIAEFLDEYFESDVIKAYLAVSAIIGTALGPMSPGTAYVLLHHYMGDVDDQIGAWGFARGGMGSVSKAIAGSFQPRRAARSAPAAGVEKILTRGRRAVGVVLESGEEVRGKLVVSNADVKRTFLKLMDERELPHDFAKAVRNFRIRGSSGKVNIALDGMPKFPALPDGHPSYRGDLHFTDSIERMERAYDDWKSGTFSADPMLDMLIPTQLDPTMTPPGKHFMTCFVQYCPPKIARPRVDGCRSRRLRQDGDEPDRQLFAELQGSCPARRGAHPARARGRGGLDRRQHLPGRAHLRSALVQPAGAGLRAIPRSPSAGLYMCGSSTHPGGGVMGAPGRNAAAEILRDLAKPSLPMSDAYAVL